MRAQGGVVALHQGRHAQEAAAQRGEEGAEDMAREEEGLETTLRGGEVMAREEEVLQETAQRRGAARRRGQKRK